MLVMCVDSVHPRPRFHSKYKTQANVNVANKIHALKWEIATNLAVFSAALKAVLLIPWPAKQFSLAKQFSIFHLTL